MHETRLPKWLTGFHSHPHRWVGEVDSHLLQQPPAMSFQRVLTRILRNFKRVSGVFLATISYDTEKEGLILLIIKHRDPLLLLMENSG